MPTIINDILAERTEPRYQRLGIHRGINARRDSASSQPA
jgi:hypothetical protein